MKKTVVFDFDSVIHSYTSPWTNEWTISDPPVEGIREAIAAIRAAEYEVVVVSRRCTNMSGLHAVRIWLDENNIIVDDVQSIKHPVICYIDDRSICFYGDSTKLLIQI